jgi:hypothetical protein
MAKSPEARLNGKLRASDPYTEQRRLESEARTAEIKQRTAKARGELISRKDVTEQVTRLVRGASTKFQGVTRKLEQLHPDVPKEVWKDCDELHREALEDLATGADVARVVQGVEAGAKAESVGVGGDVREAAG